MTLSKTQRQHRIGLLLSDHAVASQLQLVKLLAEEEGIVATQATVSRDLDEMGAVKVRVGGGQSIYAVPEHPVDQRAPLDHLRRVMGEWVVEATRSGSGGVADTAWIGPRGGVGSGSIRRRWVQTVLSTTFTPISYWRCPVCF